ncbi:uncharacterized protein EDB93DRAFT_759277 [Suillus bovinus]|uniref:uncharacterized protein n=1 Tax=Suillus bovinus TaxID=48563 RepID=UPI001B876A22|nr:uncharacterized protein EDB93DRAFT_616252 [Suillus bovinus]XP_041304423.1 uncharacterized protein EDB93DRAFT_759277 [Suillus bovinus]KAG2123442.1 hypothetical protein EDB93DRAFT_616252 [Suillus bovinus]KAG2137589.1 hypothetical protein EDB93DRAFT_759277 [Suillus bovinus]
MQIKLIAVLHVLMLTHRFSGVACLMRKCLLEKDLKGKNGMEKEVILQVAMERHVSNQGGGDYEHRQATQHILIFLRNN